MKAQPASLVPQRYWQAVGLLETLQSEEFVLDLALRNLGLERSVLFVQSCPHKPKSFKKTAKSQAEDNYLKYINQLIKQLQTVKEQVQLIKQEEQHPVTSRKPSPAAAVKFHAHEWLPINQRLQLKRKSNFKKTVSRLKFQRLELVQSQINRTSLELRQQAVQRRVQTLLPQKVKKIVKGHQANKMTRKYKKPVQKVTKAKPKPPNLTKSEAANSATSNQFANSILRREAGLKATRQRRLQKFAKAEQYREKLSQKYQSHEQRFSKILDKRKRQLREQAERMQNYRSRVQESRKLKEAQLFESRLNKSCQKMSRFDSANSAEESRRSEGRSEAEAEPSKMQDSMWSRVLPFRFQTIKARRRRSGEEAADRKQHLISATLKQNREEKEKQVQKQRLHFKEMLEKMRHRSEELMLRERERRRVTKQQKRQQERLSRRLVRERLDEQWQLALQLQKFEGYEKLSMPELSQLKQKIRGQLILTRLQ